MTLERIEHKVFASEAPLEEMGQFGSALATTKLNTKDVAEIQALPAYTKGWGSAIISENNYPAMEEMNGVLNVMSYHTGYLYQEGIPTYSATQEYSATSTVKSLDGKNIYRSLKGNNKGNPLEDKTSWELFDFSKGTLKTNQITNCITEIPQRIKLELADGVLTLKAGSIVTVPNGFEADGTTPKFDYVTIESDLSISTWGTGITNTCVLGFRKDGQTPNFITLLPNCIFSGSTKPTPNVGDYWLWYDTVSNKIKYTSDNGATWTSEYCAFSIARTQVTSSVFTSIDQTFNGIGYIGSTIWMDKGVKGLIPNGRNEDGTLKNIEITIDRLWTRNTAGITDTSTAFIIYDPLSINKVTIGTLFQGYFHSEPTAKQYGCYFNIVENRWYYSADGKSWMTRPWVACGSLVLSNSGATISNFNPKLPFRAIDYSDKSEVSGWGMPSGKYIDLTLGASGTEYTAPANGFVSLEKKSGGSNQYAILNNTSSTLRSGLNAPSSGMQLIIYIPVKKGDIFSVSYNLSGSTDKFRFYYAVGSESEAQ